MLCERCGSEAARAANFCSNCGTKLRARSDRAVPAPDAIIIDAAAEDGSASGERKLVTALFADIKNSVALIGALDPEHAHRIVHAVLGLMVDSVLKFEGLVVQPTGDGIYAIFGAPVACQDHAQRAVYAALEMQQRLLAYAAGRPAGDPLIEARAGIESGEVVQHELDTGTRQAYITVGQTVNLASRLERVARPGSVSVGEQTRRLIEGYFDLRTLPSVVFKGMPNPIAVYEVVGLGRLRRHSQIAARRDLSKFAGRGAEMRLMRQALERGIGGQGQVISLVAGAGLGKSRLVMEFSRDLPLGARVVEAYAASYARKTPWLPIVGMLQNYFSISDADDAAARRVKIDAVLATPAPDGDEVRFLLFGLLGIVDGPDPLRHMDPGVRRERTLQAIVDMLLADSLVQPVVIIFEDLHWIDTITKALLDRLAGAIVASRIVLLATSRPEYAADWSVGSNVTEIVLEPLSVEISDQLVGSLLSEDPALTALKHQIHDRTGGNPFFMEEVVHALFEDGTLARAPTRLVKPMRELHVPLTIRGVLLERIDQLGPRQKELLQVLSVLGQTLPLHLIFELSPWDSAETERLVESLQVAGFIYPLSDVRRGSNWIDYVFKHALTQEAAYQSMLGGRRQTLHKKAAGAIEALYADALDDYIGLLAHHYSAADEHPKAIEYLGKAGEQAVRRAAHGDAIGFFREALRRVDLAPAGAVQAAQLARLCSRLGASLLVTNGYAHDEVSSAYRRARDVSLAAGDDVSLALVLRGTSQIHLSRANYGPAMTAGHELLALGARDDSCLIEGNIALAIGSIYTGRLQDAEQFFLNAMKPSAKQAAVAKFQATGHTETLCRAYYAICIGYLGKLDQALSESAAAVVAAEALSIPITTAQTLAARGTTLHRLRHYDAAEACYAQALTCATKHGLPYWAAFCSMAQAAITAERDGFEAALEAFERGRVAYRGSGARLIMSWFLYLRSELLMGAGRLEEATACVDETLAFIAETGETVFETEVLRLKGTLLLRQRGSAAVAGAEACFLRGMATARLQHGKLWELRAATSLACLWAWRDRRDAAVDVLGPVYASFSEGFDAPDVADARRLLDALAGSGCGVPTSGSAGSALLLL